MSLAGNKSCKFCGFVSEDNDTLIQHQIQFHQDILKSAQAKFAKELVSAGGDESIADFSVNLDSVSEDYFSYKNSMGLLKSAKKKAKLAQSANSSSSGGGNTQSNGGGHQFSYQSTPLYADDD